MVARLLLTLTSLTMVLHTQGTDGRGGALDDQEININCKKDCGRLVLINSAGEETVLQGTMSQVKHKDVQKAKIVGSGCFIIYKSRHFTSDSLRIEGASEHVLKELGHPWTTVK
jgi:hypothetical protein